MMESVKSINDGLPVGIYRDREKQVPVLLKSSGANVQDAESLGDFAVWNGDRSAPLSQVTKEIETTWEYPQIRTYNRQLSMAAMCGVRPGHTMAEVHGEIRKEIDCLDNETERRSRELAQIFMKYKEGNVLVDTYKKMKEERDNWKLFCEERKKELEIKIRKLQKQQKEESRFLRSLVDLKGTFHINADLAESLIERMYLYDDGRLEINFRFKEAVENE